MTDIDEAAQESAGDIRHADVFMAGFRAGAEWRDRQRPDKAEALEAIPLALEALEGLQGRLGEWATVKAALLECQKALTNEREVPEEWRIALTDCTQWMKYQVCDMHTNGKRALENANKLLAAAPEPEEDK